MNQRKKIVVFLSGRGTNFRTLIEEQKKPECPFSIARVVSDKPGAAGLYYAKEANIPVTELFRSDFENLTSFKKALCDSASVESPFLYVLAGFMLVIPEWFIQEYPYSIINIHPSLLPDYPGLDTHTRAIKDKKTKHGCTVHLVRPEIDQGPLIAQSKVNILKEDTPEELAARVLKEEHRLYPWVVSSICGEKISISESGISYSMEARKDSQALSFYIPAGV